jgi:hypothetical protein
VAALGAGRREGRLAERLRGARARHPFPEGRRPPPRRRQPPHRLVGGDGRQPPARQRLGPGAAWTAARRAPALDRLDDAAHDEGLPGLRNRKPASRGRTARSTTTRTSRGVEGTMRARYEGTRLGRQELGGELLDDVEGALWTARCSRPAASRGHRAELAVVVTRSTRPARRARSADDTGIIVAGLGTDGDAYVLADRTCHLPPEGWGQRVVSRAYHEFDGDRSSARSTTAARWSSTSSAPRTTTVPFKAVTARPAASRRARSRSPRCSGRRRIDKT